MSESKTHYRKVYKSDHLGVADLEDFNEEGRDLIFTIVQVKQEYDKSVAGRKGDYNIAYFKEDIKPLVLNATNSKVVKSFAKGSSFVEDWKNITIQLYIDATVKMKGEVVGGVRISPRQPQVKKPTFIKEMFEKAKNANATIDKIKKTYLVSTEIEAEYKTYLEDGAGK
jgi:hypothetical protein